ncbi:MAG: PSD1 domain-containing protein [Planctomycetales bacterium]|nr:PSD1 domain-containing protein [Planctomycetales bacterium]
MLTASDKLSCAAASWSHRVAWATYLFFVLWSEVQGETVRFNRDIQPVLAARCFSCHGPDEAEAGLSLHTHDAALAELDSGGFAIVPGQPEQSVLLARIGSEDLDLRMPPEGEPLSLEEIAALRRWIEAGAEWEKHWAFTPLQRREPPAVKQLDWVANPIDAFLLARLEAQGLAPQPPADKRTLARRAYYNITGLPPSPEQLAEFLADDRSDAYEQLVDRLLASPRYGEKWARHWLDVVRYAETNSFERDAAKPYAYKYRDYVIRSLNDDKPYDQFVREQLAGDELDQVTADSIIATGYYRLGTWDDEPADPLQSRYDDLDNIVSTTGQGFLGLTVGCARCHDHKVDPFPQTNYYGLLSFFSDITPYALPTRRDAKYHSLWDLSPPEQKARRQELSARIEQLRSAKKLIEQQAIERMDAADQRRTETDERQQVLDEKLGQFLTSAERKPYDDTIAEIQVAETSLAQVPAAEYALALAKCDPHPDTTHVMLRGNPHALGDPVEPCFPELFNQEPPIIPEPANDARSAGRRRVLADWIASPENLLTSRVIVNRVWQHHFGRGIVRSANNFGQLGTPPTHPELLDWLACWFTDNGWSLKKLHRLILTSSAYRMSSQANEAALAIDPSNDLFWRFDLRRLSAEEIRDSVLMVSGQLNEQMYGPSIYPPLSQEVLQTQSQPGLGWGKSDPRQAARRSIYIHIKRSLLPPELAIFDFPETDTSCEARFVTTLPAQALNLLHGDFLQTYAGHLADRVRAEAGDELEARVVRTLQLVLSRQPEQASVADSLQLIERLENEHGLERDEAFRQFCVMTLNLNEFVYVD